MGQFFIRKNTKLEGGGGVEGGLANHHTFPHFFCETFPNPSLKRGPQYCPTFMFDYQLYATLYNLKKWKEWLAWALYKTRIYPTKAPIGANKWPKQY